MTLSPGHAVERRGRGVDRRTGELLDESPRNARREKRVSTGHDADGGHIREPDGHYYASFVVEVDPTPLPSVGQEAGVDLGIARLATVATTSGDRIDIANPKHLASKLRKLRRLEREKARRAKGSTNRAKTRRKVAVQHGKVTRARRDYHHKQALTLVRENQAAYVEDLNVAGMVRNRRLARSISDAGFGQVRAAVGRKSRAVRTHGSEGGPLVPLIQNVLGVRSGARFDAAPGPRMDVPVRRCPRPRPQRSDQHPRRRAGGEAKRLWSPGKPSLQAGTGR